MSVNTVANTGYVWQDTPSVFCFLQSSLAHSGPLAGFSIAELAEHDCCGSMRNTCDCGLVFLRKINCMLLGHPA